MNTQHEKINDDMFKPANLDSGQDEAISRPSIGFWKDSWIRLTKHKGALIGLILILIIIFMAIFGPFMNKYGFNDQDLMRTNLPPKVPGLAWLGFDGTTPDGVNMYKIKDIQENFWFGTDSLGRDLWTRVWEGTQISLIIAFAAAIIDCIIGVAYGGISSYYGGRVDNFMQRIIEILVGVPNLIVIILFILWLQPGITSIILALVITGWTSMARIVRGQILKLKSQEFVLAARTLGSSDSRIIWKHLIPNVLGQIIITMMFSIPSAIFFEAFLSFIGLGISPPQASLGSLNDLGYDVLTIYPYQAFFPAAVLSLLMISFNLLADGLRDAFDPKLRK